MKNKVAGKNFEPIKFNFYYWPLLNSFFFSVDKKQFRNEKKKKKSTGWVKVKSSDVHVWIDFPSVD